MKHLIISFEKENTNIIEHWDVACRNFYGAKSFHKLPAKSRRQKKWHGKHPTKWIQKYRKE